MEKFLIAPPPPPLIKRLPSDKRSPFLLAIMLNNRPGTYSTK